MHRSGTSAIAGGLGRLGFYLGPSSNLYGAVDYNSAGLFELAQIVEFNEKMRKQLGMKFNPCLTLADDWMNYSGLADDVRELSQKLSGLFEDQPQGLVKDPRISLFLPIYQEALGDLWPDTTVVICARNPMDTAESLARRDFCPKRSALGAWLQFTLCALRDSQGARRRVIAYDDFLRDPARALRPVSDLYPELTPNEEAGKLLANFVRPELDHGGHEAMDQLSPDILPRTYDLCLRMARNPKAVDDGELDPEIQLLWNEFESWWRMTPIDGAFATAMHLAWMKENETVTQFHRYEPLPKMQTVEVDFDAPEILLSLMLSVVPGTVVVQESKLRGSDGSWSPVELVPAGDLEPNPALNGTIWKLPRGGTQCWFQSKGGRQTLSITLSCDINMDSMISMMGENWRERLRLGQRVIELESMVKALIKEKSVNAG